MANEWNETILDEIDRLFVVYDKAKEYLTKISIVIDEQINTWQYRRKIIQEQTKSTSSFDFLLPKTQKINELSIDAVQALCRAEVLTEQILRLDPKMLNQTRSTSFSMRALNTDRQSNVNSFKQQSINNVESNSNNQFSARPTFPVPVLRNQTVNSSNRSPHASSQEHLHFKPIEQQQSPLPASTTPRPTPIHPQTNSYSTGEKAGFPYSTLPNYRTQTPKFERDSSSTDAPPMNLMSTMAYQPLQGKVKVKLQRIKPNTTWKQARIEVIESLSIFFVQNNDPKIHDEFAQTFNELHDYYDALEQSGQLKALENISIGDFGVVKCNDDDRWYRARLLTAAENNRIRIVYIDFGNLEVKFIDEFFPLANLFARLPAQAVVCSLSEAFPRRLSDDRLWSEDIVDKFRNEVVGKIVEIHFVPIENGTEEWPLNFVKIITNNQSVTNSLNLKQHIEPRPNSLIAQELAKSLSTQELILFNVPLTDDEVYSN